MSDVKDVELKPADRIAQASMVLVEQVGMSLLSDAYHFPEKSAGHIKTVDAGGTLKFDGPVDELVKTFMKYKQDENTKEIGTWNHTESIDSATGQTQETIDQVNRGFLLDVLISGKLGSHTDFKGADGAVQVTMDGLTVLNPNELQAQQPPTGGSWSLPMSGRVYVADSTNTLKAPDGTYLADVHLTARPSPADRNTLDILATYTNKTVPVGTVEMVVTVDPNSQQTADFQLIVKNAPPQPPTPAPGFIPPGNEF